jgi:predicted SAM-dependent methyltransferase
MDAGDRFARPRIALGRIAWRLRPPSSQPLVSIVVPTWNRAALLCERTLPSVVRQTYRNWEVVVVGDACTDDTAARVAALGDPRIRFENLPHRGSYPEDPLHRWMVAGSTPANRALELARGAWIGYLDDDDVLTEDHLETLLGFARESGAEFVFGSGEFQRSAMEWLRIGRLPPDPGNVMHSSVLYRSYLRFLRYDLEAWKASVGADAHLWGRMYRLGVRFAHVDRVVCKAPLRPGERLAGQRAAEARAVAQQIEAHSSRGRIHLGCGRIRFDGWVNIDGDPSISTPDVIWDVGRGIPVPDASCELVYSEHLLEHLKVEDGVALLRECWRVLAPGGRLRFAMPSLDSILERCAAGQWRDQDWLTWPDHQFIQTKAEMLNIVFRWWGHQWIYDAEEFHRRLREAGFTTIHDAAWGESAVPELRNRETRKDSLLICEAEKS